MDRLNWEKYDWRKFEEICYDYIKCVYTADFDIRLTSATNDGGRDIIISKSNYTCWGECKHHQKNLSLETIGKNVVLAISHEINKLIFFSVSFITPNCKIEIMEAAKLNNFDVLYLDGIILDKEICKYPKLLKEYFPESISKQYSNTICITSTISEYDTTPDIIGENKIFILKNGLNFYVHVSIFNLCKNDINDLQLTLNSNSNKALMAFQKNLSCKCIKSYTEYDFIFEFVATAIGTITLPYLNIQYKQSDEVIIDEIELGVVDSSSVMQIPLTGSRVNEFLTENISELYKIVNLGYVRALLIEGCSGIGKTRLINEIINKGKQKSFRIFYNDINENNNDEIIRELITQLLCLPYKYNKVFFDKEKFVTLFYENYTQNQEQIDEVYRFIYEKAAYSYSKLSALIVTIIIKLQYREPILLCFDNIQYLSLEAQKLLTELSDRLLRINKKCFIVYSYNTDFEQKNNILYQLLKDHVGKDNFVSVYEFKKSVNTSYLMLKELLNVGDENEIILKQIAKKCNYLPFNILLFSKSLINNKKYGISFGKNINHFISLEKINEYLESKNDIIHISVKNVIKNKDAFDFLKLLTFFDGSMSSILLDKFGLNDDIKIYLFEEKIIQEKNFQIVFSHDKYYNYFKSLSLFPNESSQTQICHFVENENIGFSLIPYYIYFKVLVNFRLDEKVKSEIKKIISYYEKIHFHRPAIDSINICLNTYMKIWEPNLIFELMYKRAALCFEWYDVKSGENYYWEAYDFLTREKKHISFELINDFYHKLYNSQSHRKKYFKGIEILKEMKTNANLSRYNYFIINDRFCVAYFHLGKKDDALKHISLSIKAANKEDNDNWRSIAYSDKAYIYFYNTMDIKKICKYFSCAIKYNNTSEENVSRLVEIYMQQSIISALKKNFSDAIIKIKEAIYYAEENNYMYLRTTSYNVLSCYEIITGDYASALETLTKSIYNVTLSSKDTDLIAIYNNLAIYYLKTLPQNSEDYFTQALSKIREIQNYNQIIKNYFVVANIIKYKKSNAVAVDELSQEFSDKFLLTHYNFWNESKDESLFMSNFSIDGYNLIF